GAGRQPAARGGRASSPCVRRLLPQRVPIVTGVRTGCLLAETNDVARCPRKPEREQCRVDYREAAVFNDELCADHWFKQSLDDQGPARWLAAGRIRRLADLPAERLELGGDLLSGVFLHEVRGVGQGDGPV